MAIIIFLGGTEIQLYYFNHKSCSCMIHIRDNSGLPNINPSMLYLLNLKIAEGSWIWNIEKDTRRH
jgi:hypothetical protein